MKHHLAVSSNYRRSLLLALLASIAPLSAHGAPCSLTLNWNSSYPLQFGSFSASSAGTVVIGSGADSVSVTGGVIHMGGTVSRARFDLTCPGFMMSSGTNYTISVDASTTLSSGSDTMTLDNFTTYDSGGGYISRNGSATIYIGGTLNANANQPAGSYSGSFSVTVNYN